MYYIIWFYIILYYIIVYYIIWIYIILYYIIVYYIIWFYIILYYIIVYYIIWNYSILYYMYIKVGTVCSWTSQWCRSTQNTVKLVEPTRNPLGTPQHPGGTPSPGSYGELQPLQRLPTSSVPQQKRRWRCYWMPLAVLLQHGCGPGQRHLPASKAEKFDGNLLLEKECFQDFAMENRGISSYSTFH